MLAELEAHWGLILIIAFLIGMGTPYPGKGKKEGWQNTLDNLERLAPLLAQLAQLLDHAKSPDRPADPDEKTGGPKDGGGT